MYVTHQYAQPSEQIEGRKRKEEKKEKLAFFKKMRNVANLRGPAVYVLLLTTCTIVIELYRFKYTTILGIERLFSLTY